MYAGNRYRSYEEDPGPLSPRTRLADYEVNEILGYSNPNDRRSYPAQPQRSAAQDGGWGNVGFQGSSDSFRTPQDPYSDNRKAPKPPSYAAPNQGVKEANRSMPGVMNGYPGGPYSAAVFDRNDLGPPPQRGGYGRQESPYRSREPPADPYRRAPPTREEIYARPHTRQSADVNGYGPSAGRFDFDDRNGPPSEISIFELDHLATFTVGPKQGLASPESGLERLRHMEMTTGIWTMQCQLAVEAKHIVVIDKTTGAEMERFPLEQVVEPTARMNRDRRDVYKNILIFSVLGERGRNPESEMHIFQCISVPAQQVVDEIKMAKEGQFAGRPAYVPKGPPRGYDDFGPGVKLATDYSRREPNLPMHRMKQRTNIDNRDTESILSDRTDRDMQMLNLCFDDIEIFVGRLQQAAEAFRELERRRQKRDKKKGPGDGMLSGRARPPPAKDFIDIFQKFKLAINLLAKLKPYIHDPNAPELVHFLFTPLSLVVEASRDPRSNTPDLPAKVVPPLLTSEAKELLQNCLTTKEMELWRSLGDAWTLSRDQWRYPVQPYSPRFYNGWQPAPNVYDDGNRAPREGPAYNEDPYRRYGGMDDPYEQRQQSPPPPRAPEPRAYAAPPPQDNGYRRNEDPYRRNEDPYRRNEDPYTRNRDYDPYRDQAPPRAREPEMRPSNPPPAPAPPQANQPQSFEDEQRIFLRDLQGRRATVCEVMHERESKNSKELSVKKGEYLEVLDRNRNWWKLKNSSGEMGHAPYTILQLMK